MPKRGLDTTRDIARLRAHKSAIQRGMAREARNAANTARGLVRQDAPVDTLGLVESVYVASQAPGGDVKSDYQERLGEAKTKNPDIERRNQVTPEVAAPPGSETRAWAAVGIVASYADPIIEGHHNVKSGRAVPPNDFFNPNVEEAAANYQKDAQLMIHEEVAKLNSK